MKTIISFLLFACLVQYARAQIPVDSFYVPGATWTVAVPGMMFSDCPDYHPIFNSKILYKIISDTVISGFKYHILGVAEGGGYAEPVHVLGPEGGCQDEGFSYTVVPENSLVFKRFARLRVDTNKVYFIQDSTFTTIVGNVPLHFTLGQEYLLYDFNLGINSIDTGFSGFYTNSIDSTVLSNGIHVAKYNDTVDGIWNVTSPDYPETIWGTYYRVWGIGSSFGLLPDSYDLLTAYGPGAIHYNGDEMALCYKNPAFSYSFLSPVNVLNGDLMGNCFDKLDVPVYKTTTNEIQLFPNPSATEITITANYTITNIAISNLLGQTVYTHACKTQKVEANIEHLPKGVYMVRINNSEVRRLVKE